MILDDVLRFFLNVIKESTWLDDPSQESMKELTTGQWTGTGCSGSATFRIDGLIWPAPVGLSRSDGDVEDANGSDPGSCQIMSKCRWQDSQGWGGEGEGGRILEVTRRFVKGLGDPWRILGDFSRIFSDWNGTLGGFFRIWLDYSGFSGIGRDLSRIILLVLQDSSRCSTILGEGRGEQRDFEGFFEDCQRIVRDHDGIF